MFKTPWSSNWFVRALQFLWGLPYGLLGFILCGLISVVGDMMLCQWSNGVLDVVVGGKIGAFFLKRNWGGFTVGWTVFYWEVKNYNPVNKTHEHEHVRQYLKYGITYLPVYFFYNLTKGYHCNPLEIAAYKKDGRGNPCISKASLEMLHRGIEDAKAGRVTDLPLSTLDDDI